MTHKWQSFRAKVGEEDVQFSDWAMVTHATSREHDEVRELVEGRIRRLMNAGENHDAFLARKSCDAGYHLFRRRGIELWKRITWE
jgi:hypothetical protein